MARDERLIAWFNGWVVTKKGGFTSGNWGHKGRPGFRGGSLPGGGHTTLGRMPPPDPEHGITQQDRIRARIMNRRAQRSIAAEKKQEARELRQGISERASASLSDFTPEMRKTVAQALSEVAYKGLRTGNEHLIAFGQDGSKINDTLEGDKSQVNARGLMYHDPAILVHNHPSGTSFSDADIAQMFYLGSEVKHLFVIGHDGTLYRMSKTDRTSSFATPTSIVQDWMGFKEDLMSEFSPKVLSGEMDRHMAWKEHTHQINVAIARIWGLDYERILPEEEGT